MFLIICSEKEISLIPKLVSDWNMVNIKFDVNPFAHIKNLYGKYKKTKMAKRQNDHYVSVHNTKLF